jgi:hypothetical protein
LKWGCLEPLVHSYFWWLGKTAKNMPIILSAACVWPLKIGSNNFRRFSNLPLKIICICCRKLLAAKKWSIFARHPKLAKVTFIVENKLLSVCRPYFQQLLATAKNRPLLLKISYFQYVGLIFSSSWPPKNTPTPRCCVISATVDH